jgi:cation diffusion facilitator CzcD-associated flavoprotein CzcO
MELFDRKSRALPKPIVREHPNTWYRDFNPEFSIVEKPLHDKKPIRIIIIGAGASGLLVAFKAARQLSNVTFVVYEKNEGVGGTWYENRYPGVEVSNPSLIRRQPVLFISARLQQAEVCAQIDSPSHTYQWTFHRSAEWSRFMSAGQEVCDYLKNWADEANVLKDVKIGYNVESAIWNEAEGHWEVAGHTNSGAPFSDRAEIVFSCTGCLKSVHQYITLCGCDDC